MNVLKKMYHSFNKLYNNAVIKRTHSKVERDNYITGRLYIRGGGLHIGNNFHCNSGKWHNPIGGDTIMRFITKGNGRIVIGNHVGISNSTLVAEAEIVIEDNVTIGGSCKIYDTDFHSITYKERITMPDTSYKVKPIRICEGAFIGANSIILKGSVIGKHSVIGAGSVIAGEIPGGEIWAGNPARFIKKL